MFVAIEISVYVKNRVTAIIMVTILLVKNSHDNRIINNIYYNDYKKVKIVKMLTVNFYRKPTILLL